MEKVDFCHFFLSLEQREAAEADRGIDSTGEGVLGDATHPPTFTADLGLWFYDKKKIWQKMRKMPKNA